MRDATAAILCPGECSICNRCRPPLMVGLKNNRNRILKAFFESSTCRIRPPAGFCCIHSHPRPEETHSTLAAVSSSRRMILIGEPSRAG